MQGGGLSAAGSVGQTIAAVLIVGSLLLLCFFVIVVFYHIKKKRRAPSVVTSAGDDLEIAYELSDTAYETAKSHSAITYVSNKSLYSTPLPQFSLLLYVQGIWRVFYGIIIFIWRYISLFNSCIATVPKKSMALVAS